MRDIGCLTLSLAFGALYALSQDYGVWGFLAGVAASLLVLGLWYGSDVWERRRQEKVHLALPCAHGVVGAVVERTRCRECQTEERRRKDQEAARRAAELARVKAEWLGKVRLPEYLKVMDPQEFEHLVCQLFSVRGYQVEPTPYVGDSGIDAYARKDGVLTIIQCKRVKGSVGEPILRDLYGAMHDAKAASAFVATTGRVSAQARAWVKDKPIFIGDVLDFL